MDERDRRSLYERVARLEQRMDSMEDVGRQLQRLFWSTLLIVGFTAIVALITQWISLSLG